jgi:hypothetical protein
MVSPLLEELFPGLAQGGFLHTSPADPHYNCIAWAAGDTGKWWWPTPELEDAFWPAGVAREETILAFQEAFATLGYFLCDGEELEPGFEKIALFADDQGIPSHAARQVPKGSWTSKIGELEDIEHALHDLEGTEYGTVVQILKRPLGGT